MGKFWLTQIIFCLLVVRDARTLYRQEFGNIAGKWKIKYGLEHDIPELWLYTNVAMHLPLEIYDIEHKGAEASHIYFEFAVGNTKIASVDKRINFSDINGTAWRGEVCIKGHYFGYTQLYLTINDPQTNAMEKSNQVLEMRVMRSQRVDIKVFTYSVVFITLLMFVNLGTVLDLKRMRLIFIRPVGPLLGFCSRFMIMPALAFCLSALFFLNDKNLQLALFLTSISPTGGISNMANVFLRGNINLSLAITTVNSILALGMLPLWIFLMGPIFNQTSSSTLPFLDLLIGCVGLVMALVMGVMLRVFAPKTTEFIFRFLKPVSMFLSLCLVVVIVGINAFAFKEVTLMIFLVSIFLPLIGYILCFILSKLFCRCGTDSMTIAVEASVLNMSLPIVLMEYTVEQPRADMLAIVPILSALMSLFFIAVFYTVRRIFGWNTSREFDSFDEKTYLVE